MKVLICLSLFVAVTLALPPRPLPDFDDEHDHDHSFPRPMPGPRPPMPEDISPELQELHRDVMDFVKLLPHREMHKLVKQAFKNDEEMRETIRYLRSPAFHEVMKEIEALPEVQALGQHFQPTEIATRAILAVDAEIAIDTLPGVFSNHHTGGLCGLIDRIIDILPHNELRALHREKVANGGVFAEIVAFLTSDEFKAGVEKVFESQRFQELDATLRENGVCMDKFVELGMNVFGFH
ncbi:uncharacterized protein LOC132259022 [Phlebotomus argentipes]|uniref:uncharacterized protein LOC132259022 n=1 Tax=Phlebotomus argentipes TaxID=94469 RepID=UPI0028936C9F|nr:uncharacterized protein LOC132259022 [Phlebotomus argentipes]